MTIINSIGGTITLIIACALLCIFVCTLDMHRKYKWIITTLLGILIIFLFSIIFYGNEKMKSISWEYPDKPYSVEYIVSLNDNNLISGSFYLRSGHIDENLYYQYMVKMNNGGYVSNKVNSKNTIIYYSDDNFRVEWWTRSKKYLWFKVKDKINKVYIPEGSISDMYSIDLK